MPLYEFRCESCGHEVETLMAFSDPVPTTCEACGGALKKLLSAPAVQFKGSGFYLTDYGRAGNSPGSGKKEPGAEGGESKGSAATKPAGEAKSGPAGGASAASGSDAKPAG